MLDSKKLPTWIFSETHTAMDILRCQWLLKTKIRDTQALIPEIQCAFDRLHIVLQVGSVFELLGFAKWNQG